MTQLHETGSVYDPNELHAIPAENRTLVAAVLGLIHLGLERDSGYRKLMKRAPELEEAGLFFSDVSFIRNYANKGQTIFEPENGLYDADTLVVTNRHQWDGPRIQVDEDRDSGVVSVKLSPNTEVLPFRSQVIPGVQAVTFSSLGNMDARIGNTDVRPLAAGEQISLAARLGPIREKIDKTIVSEERTRRTLSPSDLSSDYSDPRKLAVRISEPFLRRPGIIHIQA